MEGPRLPCLAATDRPCRRREALRVTSVIPVASAFSGRTGADAWIAPAEVAARLKVSRATVYALVKSGELEHKRVGLQIRIALTHLERFLRG